MSNAGLARYAAGMGVLAVAFYVFPSWHVLVWSLIGVGSVGAILLGVRINRPRRRAPWYWTAVGVASFSTGDVLYYVLADVGDDPNPFPSFADGFYLATYVFLAIGILGLARAGAASRDRSVALDAVIFTAGLGLIFWIFLIGPRLADPTMTLTERLISIAYPLGDIILVTVISRLITVVRPSPSVILLVVGAMGTLVSDILYGVAQLGGTFTVGTPMELGWITFYTAWGAAAMHPSMAELTEPRVLRPRQLGLRYQLALLLAVLVPLGVLFVEAADSDAEQFPVVAVAFVAITVAVALVRLFGVINANRRNLLRGQGLRQANVVMMKATNAAEVETAIRIAVERMLPGGTQHHLQLVLNDGAVPDLFAAQPAGTRMAYSRNLPAEVDGRLSRFEITLICPLALPDRPGGDPHIGALLIAADEVSLGQLQLPMELVASQAALALERIQLAAELDRSSSEQYFRTLVHNATDVILILEPDGDLIRYASPSAPTVFGAAELAGERLSGLMNVTAENLTRDLLSLAHQDTGDAVRLHRPSTNGDHGDGPVADWTVLRHDGTAVQAEVSCRDLRAEPTVSGLVVTLRDVTDQRRLQAELTYRAFHDSLTGLANRVLFAERIRQAIGRAQDAGGVTGLLFLDLDDFKLVNDSFGHDYGDQLLVAVGKRLTAALRPGDSAARLGGDEFAALIEDAPDADAIDRVAERVIAVLSEPFTIDGRVVSGQASIGVATSEDNPDGQDLLRQADLALYVAKNAGKGQWRRFQPSLHTAMVRRMELRAALDEAIAAGSFVLEFQPIVGLRSRRTAGFEALVRWDHPKRGRLLPDHFIEVAEESGLIVPIGAWVLRHAVAEAARWQRVAGADAPYVSINVSARQFRAPGFVASVRAALAEEGLPAERLMLEITESLLLRDDDQIWDDLVELRRAGVRVAIDDFGTGYSSLSYLRHVPLDALKIDRLFTSTIATSGQQAALVDGIVKLAQTLGLEVIAEGIERPAERDLLARFGCRYGQGYLFSPPLPAAEALERVTAEPPLEALAPRPDLGYGAHLGSRSAPQP